MYLNFAVVLLLTALAAANHCENGEEMKKQAEQAFLACCKEFGYMKNKEEFEIFVKKIEDKKNKICSNEDENLKKWATCTLKRMKGMDDNYTYEKEFFFRSAKDEHKTNMKKCEDKINSPDIAPEQRACTLMDCMNEYDIKPCFDEDEKH